MTHRFIILLCTYSILIHSTNDQSFQAQSTTHQSTNIFKALTYELKNPLYQTEILPNDLGYLTRLVANGVTNNHSPYYLRSITKLFSNMLKKAEYTNASAVDRFLEQFKTDAQPYFALQVSRSYITNAALYDAHMLDRFKSTVNNALYFKFSSDYESFRSDPTQFLENLSGEILNLAQEEITHEQLRQGIIRFFEIALGKLIWDVTNPEKSWSITKKIADDLAYLLEVNILSDVNDLDDLYWTLLSRYAYFINVTATDTHPSFFTALKDDLATGNIILFELAEQDTMIESKLSYLQRTIFAAEAQSRAYHMRMGTL